MPSHLRAATVRSFAPKADAALVSLTTLHEQKNSLPACGWRAHRANARLCVACVCVCLCVFVCVRARGVCVCWRAGGLGAMCVFSFFQGLVVVAVRHCGRLAAADVARCFGGLRLAALDCSSAGPLFGGLDSLLARPALAGLTKIDFNRCGAVALDLEAVRWEEGVCLGGQG